MDTSAIKFFEISSRRIISTFKLFCLFLLLIISLVSCNQLGNSYNFHSGFNIPRKLEFIHTPSIARGSEVITITFSLPSNAVSAELEYSSDGGTSFTNISHLAPYDVFSVWTVPSIDSNATILRLSVTSLQNEVETIESPAFEIDSTVPAAPSVTLLSANPTASSEIQLSVSDCTDTSKILLSPSSAVPSETNPSWQNCSTLAGAITGTLTSGDGSKDFYVFAIDDAGNISSSQMLTIVLDQNPPVINLSQFLGGEVISGNNAYQMSWTSSDAGTGLMNNSTRIEISSDGGSSWSILEDNLSNVSPYSWTPGNINSGTYRIKISVSDNMGNRSFSSSTSNFTIDSDPPIFSSGFMKINGASSGQTTVTRFVNVSFKMVDLTTKVTHFCLKYNISTSPSSSDACWISVSANPPGLTPSDTVNVINYPFELGLGQSIYIVYGWAMDSAGNISELSDSGAGTVGEDKASIEYLPGSPPTLINVIATSSDTPSSPLSSTDVTTSGGAVYIKWKASDDEVLPSNPIDLSYTVNDVDYINIATNLPNSTGTDCTITSDYSGCYKWETGSPSSGYYRVRVSVKDSVSTTTMSTSNALNVYPPINILAGNTEPGLDSSASAAIFFSNSSNGTFGDPQSFVISDNGTIYFRDVNRGILKVDPTSGVQSVFIPQTGTSSGDGGVASDATLSLPTRIALDYQNNLLILDKNRIRKVDLNSSPPVINNFIGGGASTADGILPTDVQITSYNLNTQQMMPFFALPNGDFYFADNLNSTNIPSEGFRLRFYDASAGKVFSFTFNGTGSPYNPTQDLSFCKIFGLGVEFDPGNSEILAVTSKIRHSEESPLCTGSSLSGPIFSYLYDINTQQLSSPKSVNSLNSYIAYTQGRNGKLYGVASNGVGYISVYNSSSDTWTAIAGNGDQGVCSDGTSALSCSIDPSDVFVTAQGKVYFSERGIVRQIDDAGNIRTVMGQPHSYGDGLNPLSARFGKIDTINYIPSTGEILVYDTDEFRIKSFLSGGTLVNVAGNGVNSAPADNSTAATSPIQGLAGGTYYPYFTSNPVTGEIFIGGGNGFKKILKLNRSTGQWEKIVGGGATPWPTADGSLGSQIDLSGKGSQLVGWDGSHVLLAISIDDANSMIKSFNVSDGTQTHLAGRLDEYGSGNFCTDGVALDDCSLPGPNKPFSGMIWDNANSRWLASYRGTNQLIRTLTPGGSFGTLGDLGRDYLSFAYNASTGMVYFCDSDTGILRKTDFTTQTALAWPIPSMKCTGNSLIYDSANSRLIFPFTQNGLYGVAEYLNP